MKFLLTFFLLFSNLAFSQFTNQPDYGPYDEVICNPQPININAGDVISADVLNEILNRVNNLQTGGINTEQDLVGEWSCTSTCRPGVCGGDGRMVVNGYWKNSLGLYIVSQTLDITSIEDGKKINMSYPYNLGQSFVETGAQSCNAIVRNGKIFMSEPSGGETNECDNTGNYSIEMVANQCFRMGNINDSVTNCKRNNIPPAAPLNLKVSISGSFAYLTWQKGDDRQTGYVLKRKQSVDGAYEALASVSNDSYSDNSISSGNTYWYRVFGINEYGEGTGSNVVTITYSE